MTVEGSIAGQVCTSNIAFLQLLEVRSVGSVFRGGYIGLDGVRGVGVKESENRYTETN